MRGSSCPTRGSPAAPWAALFPLTAVLTLQDIRLDYWWHLRTGQLIAEMGALTHDVYLRRSGPKTSTGLPAGAPPSTPPGHAAVVAAQFALVCLWLAALAPIGWRPGRVG
jgi:hypothetical protein